MFWNTARLRRISIALLIAFAASIAVGYSVDEEGRSLLKRGDFPGFYVLAKILESHPAERLYDPHLQREIENRYWPSFAGSFYMSVYPPYDAILLKPLALFSPQAAQLLFTIGMAAFYILSFFALAKINPSLRPQWLHIAVICLCFAPNFYAIFGAQNTALSMLLYSGAIYGSFRIGRKWEAVSGVCLGLWLFKPQFGLLALATSLFTRRMALLAGAALPALIFYLMGSSLMGYLWPLNWWKAASGFAEQNLEANAQQMVSLPAAGKILMKIAGLGSDSIAAGGIIISCVVTGVLLWFLLGVWKDSRSSPEKFRRFLLLLGPGVVLVSPQTLFYDLGIALVSLIAVMDFKRNRDITELLLLCAAVLPITFFRESIAVPLFPLVALYIGAAVWTRTSSS
ncbi:MAG: DUF2029 domain-containing protein [Deltaproteobacteria bacterium]|nr:DUF2029 domain-containing protein [Deltaproteobacteria bacterium]